MKLRLLFLTLLLISLATPVRSQESTPPATLPSTTEDPLARAEADYRYQFDLYRQAYAEYTRTKATWESTGGIKAEQEALLAAKQAAITRADAMITYTVWLRLQLLPFASVYPKITTNADELVTQITWLQQHKANVQAAGSTTAFDQVMKEYSDPLTQIAHDKLYSLAQLELKLAKFSYFQHQSRALYDPVLEILETKTASPEVEQGLSRVSLLGDEVNSEITAISNLGGSLEAESFSSKQLFRKSNERLAALQVKQITLLDLMLELESRYAR